MTKIAQVYETEAKVNRAHKEVDDACVKLLALQQPLQGPPPDRGHHQDQHDLSAWATRREHRP